MAASRGILAVSAGYRLVGLGASGVDDCVADVRDGRAVRHKLAPWMESGG
jgi:hypothetical protein